MFAVGVRHRLRAVHALQAQGGSEALPHAHDYRVEWSCGAPALDARGYAVDISLAQRCLAEICGRLEGADLNGLPFFASRPPSVENLAVYLAREMRACVAAEAAVAGSKVTIWESEDAWASFAEEGA